MVKINPNVKREELIKIISPMFEQMPELLKMNQDLISSDPDEANKIIVGKMIEMLEKAGVLTKIDGQMNKSQLREIYARLADPGITKTENSLRLLGDKSQWHELDEWFMEDGKFTHVIESENCTLSFKAPEPSKKINLLVAGKIYDFICAMLLETKQKDFEFDITDFFNHYNYGMNSHGRSADQDAYKDFVRVMHFMSTVHVRFTGISKNKKPYNAHGNMFAYAFVENSNKTRLKISVLWADELMQLVEDKNAMYLLSDTKAHQIGNKRHNGKDFYIKQALEQRYANNKSSRDGSIEVLSMEKLIDAYGTTESQLKKKGRNHFAEKVANILDDFKQVGFISYWDYKNVPPGRGGNPNYADSMVEFELNEGIAKAYDGMKTKKKEHIKKKQAKKR